MQASRKSLALQNLLADAASGTFLQGNLVGNQLLPKCLWGILQAGLALKPVRKPLDTAQRGEWQSVALCLHQPRAPPCPGPSVKAVKGSRFVKDLASVGSSLQKAGRLGNAKFCQTGDSVLHGFCRQGKSCDPGCRICTRGAGAILKRVLKRC